MSSNFDLNMNSDRAYSLRHTLDTLILDTYEGSGMKLPEVMDENMKVRKKLADQVLVVDVAYNDGPSFEVILLGDYDRDGWHDYVFRAEMDWPSLGDDGSSVFDLDQLSKILGTSDLPVATQKMADRVTEALKRAHIISM